jgi:hypothetical protein
MIHDYLASGLQESPLRYVERYYAHYPKVAIGIWPPLHHAIAAVWMLPFGVSRSALLLLSALVIAVWAFLLGTFVKRLYGTALGLMASALLVLLARNQWNGSTFMLDGAVGLASFVAMLVMERYFRTERIGAAVALGFAIGAAMMIKGNANALVFMVGFMLLATRRFDLLRKPPLYVAGAIVLGLGLPWQLLTLRFLSQGGNVVGLNFAAIGRNIQGYLKILAGDFTAIIAVLLVLGFVLAFRNAPAATARRPLSLAAAACLFLAVFVFHCVAPVFGSLDARYMSAAMAPGIVLFIAGCHYVCRLGLPNGASPARRLAGLISVALLSAAWLGAFTAPRLPALGFIETADVALAANNPCCTILVCSDSNGEGAFISEVAMRDRNLSRVTLRGTKIISESSWNGKRFRMLYQNDADLERVLDENAVDVVIVDQTKVESPLARALLVSALHRTPEKWNVSTLKGSYQRVFDIYVRKNRQGLRWNTLRLRMPFTLGRDINLESK